MGRGHPRPIVMRAMVVALLFGAGALVMPMMPAGATPRTPRAKPVVMLKSIAYYTVNNGSTFCRYQTPQSSVAVVGGGTASQARNRAGKGFVTLSINGATGYADDGFYEGVGALGHLAGYVIKGRGSFGSNLWFDTNSANNTASNGDFFSWSGNCLSGTDGDVYGLGPSSAASGRSQVETVTGSSDFDLTCNSVYEPVTLTQLQAGFCSGIGGTTPVAVWVGITAGSGGTLSAKIIKGNTKTQ